MIVVFTSKLLSFLKKNNRWFAFLQMLSVFTSKVNLSSKTVPKYLRKSMNISLVLDALMWRKDWSHQLTNSSSAGPWSYSDPRRRLTITESSAYLRTNLDAWLLWHSCVYKQNKRGVRTHPWGDPVEEKHGREKREEGTAEEILTHQYNWARKPVLSVVLYCNCYALNTI